MFNLAEKLPNDLKDVKTDDLRKRLPELFKMSIETLREFGRVYKELDSRNALTNEERYQFRTGMTAFIPLIGSNKLEPELMWECMGQQKVLSSIAELPMPQQKELAMTKTVQIVDVFNGHKTIKVKRLSELSEKERKQVFADGHIRTMPEQLKFIQSNQSIKDEMPAYREARYIAIEKNNLIVSNMYVEIPRVLKELSKHFKVDLEKLLKSKGKLK